MINAQCGNLELPRFFFLPSAFRILHSAFTAPSVFSGLLD
jgi:hypothetical protein